MAGFLESRKQAGLRSGPQRQPAKLSALRGRPADLGLPRRADGFIHVAVGFLAGFAVALVAALQVLEIVLKNGFAVLAQLFFTGFGQGSLGVLLGLFVWMRAEVLDGVKRLPVDVVLALTFADGSLVYGVNQEIVGRQNEQEPDDQENQESLEHVRSLQQRPISFQQIIPAGRLRVAM